MDVEARRFASFPHWLLEARRFASFLHWLLEAKRFASFLHWLVEAKRFASFTQTAIYILWTWKREVSLHSPIGCWKRDVSLSSFTQTAIYIYIYCGRGSETFRFLPPLVVGSETFRFLPPLVVGSETFRFLPPLVVGSETFRFFHPNNNIYIVGVEARRFASTRQFSFASARTIMERTTRFQKHIMFEGILSHIMLNTAFPYSVYD